MEGILPSICCDLQLRQLKSELMVEDVIRNRTQEAFHVKCRDHVAES